MKCPIGPLDLDMQLQLGIHLHRVLSVTKEKVPCTFMFCQRIAAQDDCHFCSLAALTAHIDQYRFC